MCWLLEKQYNLNQLSRRIQTRLLSPRPVQLPLGSKGRGTTRNDNGQDSEFLPTEALASYCAGPEVHGDRVAIRFRAEPQLEPPRLAIISWIGDNAFIILSRDGRSSWKHHPAANLAMRMIEVREALTVHQPCCQIFLSMMFFTVRTGLIWVEC